MLLLSLEGGAGSAPSKYAPGLTPSRSSRCYIANLPLHSTPMDEASGPVCKALLEHSMFPHAVFGNLPYPAGQTLPTQAAGSLHCIISEQDRLDQLNLIFKPHSHQRVPSRHVDARRRSSTRVSER